MAKGKMIEEISEDKGVPIPKIRNILKDSGFNGGLINNLNDDQISELFTQYNERVTKLNGIIADTQKNEELYEEGVLQIVKSLSEENSLDLVFPRLQEITNKIVGSFEKASINILGELTLSDVMSDLMRVVNIPKSWKEISQDEKEWLEKKLGKSLEQKKYADTKSKVITKIINEWIQYDKNYQDNFKKLIAKLPSPEGEKDTSKKLLLEKIFSVAYEAYNPYQKLATHEARIKQMLIDQEIIEKEEDVKLEVNGDKGVNQGYIATDTSNGIKYYIKTFSDDSRLGVKGKIDPCEPLVYKIIEHMGFGPKTYFLIEYGSSSGNSPLSTYSGNYIVTEAVDNEGKTFALDLPSNKSRFDAIAKTKEFAGEMQCAAAIKDILSVWDTFNANPKNYGIVFDSQKTDDTIAVQFVDHLPNANNGILAEISSLGSKLQEQYSPRDNLDKEFKAKQKLTKEKSPLVDLAIGSKALYKTEELREFLIDKLFKNDTKHSNLREAIKKASIEIQELINEYGVNFADSAKSKLQTYVEKIYKNIQTFSEVMSNNYNDPEGFLSSIKDAMSDIKEGFDEGSEMFAQLMQSKYEASNSFTESAMHLHQDEQEILKNTSLTGEGGIGD